MSNTYRKLHGQAVPVKYDNGITGTVDLESIPQSMFREHSGDFKGEKVNTLIDAKIPNSSSVVLADPETGSAMGATRANFGVWAINYLKSEGLQLAPGMRAAQA